MIHLRLILLCCMLAGGAEAFAARPEKSEGFWERLWGSTAKGSKKAWETTKDVTGKTVDTARNPFGKKEKAAAAPGWNQLQMALKVEPKTVKLPETRSVQATVILLNETKKAVVLRFPTTERIEVILRAEGGKLISRWSDDQKVEGEPGIVTVNPKERLEYLASISTRDLAAGKSYQLEAYFPAFDELRVSKVIVVEN